jgi:outer membrane protein assembly factor BamB
MKTKLIFLLALLTSQGFSQFFAPMMEVKQADLTEKPVLLWKYKTNGAIVGSPVIEGQTVFVGSLDSTLYALDLTTGKVKWKLPSGGAIRSSVCLSNQRLYLLNSSGMLFRIAQDSGRVDGYFQTMTGFMGDQQADFADYFTSTPVIVDSTIYFGSGETIYAISITDGYIRWFYKTGGNVHTTPAISHNRLYAGSFDGHLYCIDTRTGNLVWKFKTTGKSTFPKGEVMGNPVVSGGMVFAGARDYNLYAVDVRGGYCSWMKQFPAGWALPVTVNDTVVYAGTSDDRKLFALELTTGKELWNVNAGFNIFGGCVVGSAIGYFCTLSGKVFGVELSKGKILWTIELDSYKANRLKWLKADDSYRDDIGSLAKVPTDILNMYKDLGGIFGTPAMAGDQLVVAGYDGWVYCFSGGTK